MVVKSVRRQHRHVRQEGEREFTPPDYGEMIDWVLVLGGAVKKYPPPGKK
jgi:hypothetical protein